MTKWHKQSRNGYRATKQFFGDGIKKPVKHYIAGKLRSKNNIQTILLFINKLPLFFVWNIWNKLSVINWFLINQHTFTKHKLYLVKNIWYVSRQDMRHQKCYSILHHQSHIKNDNDFKWLFSLLVHYYNYYTLLKLKSFKSFEKFIKTKCLHVLS
jgi:hypothetical protein